MLLNAAQLLLCIRGVNVELEGTGALHIIYE